MNNKVVTCNECGLRTACIVETDANPAILVCPYYGNRIAKFSLSSLQAPALRYACADSKKNLCSGGPCRFMDAPVRCIEDGRTEIESCDACRCTSGDDWGVCERRQRTELARLTEVAASAALIAKMTTGSWVEVCATGFPPGVVRAVSILLSDYINGAAEDKSAVQLANWVAEGNPPAPTWNTISSDLWPNTYFGWQRRVVDRVQAALDRYARACGSALVKV